MLHAAFFRNMNLGQARSLSPTRAVLEEAFRSAGARQVRSFQTNGTVAFDPVDGGPGMTRTAADSNLPAIDRATVGRVPSVTAGIPADQLVQGD